MKANPTSRYWQTVATIAAIILLLLTTSTAQAGNPNPRVLPVNANAYGKSYSEWEAAWWHWVTAIPTTAHPLTDTADCSTGQSGHVWFLGGSFTSITAERDCSVPTGTALFFPILNVDCSTVENPPFHGDNAEELQACAKTFVNTYATGPFLEIDGNALQNVEQYRVQSPVLTFSAVDPNVLFVPGPVSGQLVGDGFFVLLPPLPAGQHSLHFGGSYPAFDFSLDFTYHLTVR